MRIIIIKKQWDRVKIKIKQIKKRSSANSLVMLRGWTIMNCYLSKHSISCACRFPSTRKLKQFLEILSNFGPFDFCHFF